MQDYPGTTLESLKSDKQRHLRKVKADDGRKREKGLKRIAIWVPSTEAERFKQAARRAVDRHLNGDVPACIVEIPKPWRDPKPRDDSRQGSLGL